MGTADLPVSPPIGYLETIAPLPRSLLDGGIAGPATSVSSWYGRLTQLPLPGGSGTWPQARSSNLVVESTSRLQRPSPWTHRRREVAIEWFSHYLNAHDGAPPPVSLSRAD